MKIDLILIYGEIRSISAIDAIASEQGARWIWYFGHINFTLVGYLSYISRVPVTIVPLYLYCLKYPPPGYDIVDGRYGFSGYLMSKHRNFDQIMMIFGFEMLKKHVIRD